ncbi:MAG TPA: tRNA (guanosine(37)-N1)-methyltransferase TrmD, partial [Candidatus Hydrogenedentes bacterium]|nr:tRNA (guanosine(37)-N1)-methyltransferase TrmD [Candidatus Hydrogenedentota bacterium]
FYDGLLGPPQYTRPAVFRGMAVPEVLLSGNHAAIRRWRRKEALRMTLRRRPDLLAARSERDELSKEDKQLISEILREDGGDLNKENR